MVIHKEPKGDLRGFGKIAMCGVKNGERAKIWAKVTCEKCLARKPRKLKEDDGGPKKGKTISIRPHYGGLVRYLLRALRYQKLDAEARDTFEQTITDIADYAESCAKEQEKTEAVNAHANHKGGAYQQVVRKKGSKP